MKKLVLIALLFSTITASAQTNNPSAYRKDFDYLWNTIDSNYCYFNKKPIDWNKVKTIYAPQIDTVTTRNSFVTIIEQVLNELYDHHISPGTNTDLSRRLVPTGADIWAEFHSGRAIVTEVRKGFGAEKVGITAGMEVVAVNGVPVNQALLPFLAHTADIEAKNYALRLLLAGDHVTKRVISLKNNDGVKDYYPDKDELMLEHVKYQEMVESKIIGEVGYIKVNNFLFDNSIIAKFDSVLNKLLQTKALIIDMRETPSGGNTSVARAILGRFITAEHFYQKHEYYAEEKETGIKRSWEEIVSPRGITYTKPLVILADHWTGSIAEGITIGFDGMKRATVIGTTLARLNGSVESFRMPNTKIGFNIPTERLYHVSGLPRELYKPTIVADVTKQKPGAGGDVILNRALAFLSNKTK
ncbi:S41 family peptidase [Mucilaginibacter flavidus]|uniref:S41 family peptidase n=1 Tax=Mucilaginibacter flavidus TaxID=2949309 RepID=UPI0020932B95|nr:S41 family peptidase [Mucilaginibacter flavidus]MCO5946414.1 S41 family peptidase [Mucilaginibacter flavidus]